MLYDVINAEYIENYKLKIEFEDGSAGIVDFSEYLEKGGVFAKFKDLNFFKNFIVSKELGTIVWANEIDIAPETLYEKCRQIVPAES
ncbi:MAG: DUF2442 domain-containing protein [Calditrichaeota bacterium]|nr:DUF2442 domain-containing protein [Calditrichota bacterium]